VVRASVIIRSKNKADTIEDTLWRLSTQSVAPEIVVVDSGSTDGTLDIARRYTDRIIEIPPESFSFGGALNIGAEAARGEIHFAVSAHATPHTSTWIEDSLALYARDDVAGTNHSRFDPYHVEIDGVHYQTALDVVQHGWWGFSNHGSSWRADVWREIPFREDLPAVEDKEWSWRAIAAGWTIAYAPHLGVTTWHRRKDGVLGLYRRILLERGTLRAMDAVEPVTLAETVRTWLHPEPSVPGQSLAVRGDLGRVPR
jgi:rhamnosyltransferase